MHLVKSPLLQAARDRPSPHSERQQLLSPQNAVLPPRQPLDLPLKNLSGWLSTYTVLNPPLVSHAIDGEARGRTRGAHFVPSCRLKARKRPQPAVAASGFDPFM
jgi:hypothetical protein